MKNRKNRVIIDPPKRLAYCFNCDKETYGREFIDAKCPGEIWQCDECGLTHSEGGKKQLRRRSVAEGKSLPSDVDEARDVLRHLEKRRPESERLESEDQ